MNLDSSFQKTISDACLLAERLRGNERVLDNLIREVIEVKFSIKSMQQYQEDTLSFSEISKNVNRGHTKTPLIICLAAENKQVEYLKQQNKTLNASIDEYENTLEMIMTKYRIQMTGLMRITNLEKCLEKITKENLTVQQNVDSSIDLNTLLERYETLEKIMLETVENADHYTEWLQDEMNRLRKENIGLREMLCIATSENQTVPQSTIESSNEHSNTDIKAEVEQTRLSETQSISSLFRTKDLPSYHSSYGAEERPILEENTNLEEMTTSLDGYLSDDESDSTLAGSDQ